MLGRRRAGGDLAGPRQHMSRRIAGVTGMPTTSSATGRMAIGGRRDRPAPQRTISTRYCMFATSQATLRASPARVHAASIWARKSGIGAVLDEVPITEHRSPSRMVRRSRQWIVAAHREDERIMTEVGGGQPGPVDWPVDESDVELAVDHGPRQLARRRLVK